MEYFCYSYFFVLLQNTRFDIYFGDLFIYHFDSTLVIGGGSVFLFLFESLYILRFTMVMEISKTYSLQNINEYVLAILSYILSVRVCIRCAIIPFSVRDFIDFMSAK